MNRRNANSRSGWVNFPVDNPSYTNSREGGMVVKMVVVAPLTQHADEPEFAQCCGAMVHDQLTEILVGDDMRPQPIWSATEQFSYDQIVQYDIDMKKWKEYHYPFTEVKESPHEFQSIPYLASVVIASTGWSGWNTITESSWHCTFNDLTDDGKAMYSMFQKLYPGATIHLLTFLDT